MIIGDVYQDGHSANSLFAVEDAVHRYNPTVMQRALREALLARGIEINTADVNVGRVAAFELHIEGRPLGEAHRPRYLIALENPYINTLNPDRDYLARFERVFAWDARVFDLPNVTPILIPHPMQARPFVPFAARDRFSCLINANKHFPVVLETDLYRERLAVIRWYERHAPDQFDLYGIGWNKPERGIGWRSAVRRRLQRLASQLFGIPPFPSWRGEVRDKAEVYARTRFAFCYENVRDLTNYVTEKMLDSLLCGCVPVYWGADNVSALIPEDCYVDRRQFADTAALHQWLLAVDETRYEAYQTAIRRFLGSDQAARFSVERFVSVVAQGVASDLAARGWSVRPETATDRDSSPESSGP